MESGALGMDTSAAPDSAADHNVACLRRRAWAQSRDSVWQESEPEAGGPQGPRQSQRAGDEQRPEERGQVPNKITSWLIECRTPLGASLDDQSASPNKGPVRNGCSFEDDLSLGAEANHLQSSNNKPESCFGLAADQKRSQFKERGRSMNSTGSGKSSTVSSVSEVLEKSEEHPEEILLTLRVSELLDLYEEDPEEILLNLGFGREEPDLGSKVPSRFFNNSSVARGIDIKVYLGAQLQRMELENPNYALTSRFRQIEVLTSVANEFFQLYSQVSGQPVPRISTRDQGGDGGEGGAEEPTPPLKKSNSALNVAKLLKKTFSKTNLHAGASQSPEAPTANTHTQQNGHTPPDHTHTNGDAHGGPQQDGGGGADPEHPETANHKHNRKKDSRSLATVTEETNWDGETDSPEQSSSVPAAIAEHQPESAVDQRTEEGTQEVKEEEKEKEEEKNLTSTPEKDPPTLAPPQLAQLRTENADSFDMEEIQSNEDEALPPRNSRGNDLLRTVSQQSDSSGFAEEPSVESSGSLKVQDSSDSCDSETTVTSHPSQDVATPLALDHPAFDLPDATEEAARPGGAAKADGRRSSRGDSEEHHGISEQVPQYSAHQLPKNRPMGAQQDETRDAEQAESEDRTAPKPEPQLEPEISQRVSGAEQEPQSELEHNQNQPPSKEEPRRTPSETAADTEDAEDEARENHAVSDDSDSLFPAAPPSPIVSALNRAKQNQLSRAGQRADPQAGDAAPNPGGGRGRGQGRGRGRGGVPLQRSSSLPSSLLSPSRVVSSVRIQFGRGQASCTQPRFSFKYTQEDGGDKEEEKEEEEKEEDGQTSCLSTLIINPASSSDPHNQPPQLHTEAPVPPKPIPRHLMRSSYSLQSSSPPPDWPLGGHAHSWSTQSVPDLTSNQPPLGQRYPHSMSANQNQQSWNPPPLMFPYPNPNLNPADPFFNPSPNPSPRLDPGLYPFAPNPPPQFPSPLHPYASLPNLHHHHNPSWSLASLHQPPTPIMPQHSSLSNLHQPSPSAAPHHASLAGLHPGTPPALGLPPPLGFQSPYASPHGSHLASPYLGYHGYMNPHLPQYPHLAPQCPPELGLHPSLGSPAASSTEMQLRRVLHDIRGTVQSLSQNRADTPSFGEHRAALSSHQSLAEFHRKRQSLNLFRSQMMDLELSIIRQQALVYKHLSPADRLEVEQLQALRSEVREELQELEQQLEDRLMELTRPTPHRGLHRDSSVDSLSTASALRAMEPVSDLLREQLLLQSELSYDGRPPSTAASSRSASPARGDPEQRQGVYRASININPVPPPRPNAHTEEEEEEEEEKGGGGGGGGGGPPEEEGAAGGVRVENLQQLIREIRESVAQEVRREIYSELLATVSPRRSPLPARQHPL